MLLFHSYSRTIYKYFYDSPMIKIHIDDNDTFYSWH